MNLRILFAASLLAVSTAALAEDRFDRTLNVSAQPDLYVSTGSGNITVHEGSGNQIQVIGHVHAGWSAFGDIGSRIQHILQSPPIVQDGNTVRIGENVSHEMYENITIDYEITAPAAVALNLHSGSGDIETDHLGRYISASSGSGNVRARGISGPAELQTGSGDIELGELAAGDVKARTGSGNVHIHGLNGGLIAHSGSGDIDADGHLNGAATLESGSGSVKLHLGNDAHFNLEASTGSGDIRVNFPNAPHQDDHSRHHLTGPVNGGGPPLEVRTGSGDVEISG
jgi:DUF4097 and DUF4098 domain-containing protein YvlB